MRYFIGYLCNNCGEIHDLLEISKSILFSISSFDTILEIDNTILVLYNDICCFL